MCTAGRTARQSGACGDLSSQHADAAISSPPLTDSQVAPSPSRRYRGTEWEYLLALPRVPYRRDRAEADAMVRLICERLQVSETAA
jgi:hypothetical protein